MSAKRNQKCAAASSRVVSVVQAGTNGTLAECVMNCEVAASPAAARKNNYVPVHLLSARRVKRKRLAGGTTQKKKSRYTTTALLLLTLCTVLLLLSSIFVFAGAYDPDNNVIWRPLGSTNSAAFVEQSAIPAGTANRYESVVATSYGTFLATHPDGKQFDVATLSVDSRTGFEMTGGRVLTRTGVGSPGATGGASPSGTPIVGVAARSVVSREAIVSRDPDTGTDSLVGYVTRERFPNGEVSVTPYSPTRAQTQPTFTLPKGQTNINWQQYDPTKPLLLPRSDGNILDMNPGLGTTRTPTSWGGLITSSVDPTKFDVIQQETTYTVDSLGTRIPKEDRRVVETVRDDLKTTYTYKSDDESSTDFSVRSEATVRVEGSGEVSLPVNDLANADGTTGQVVFPSFASTSESRAATLRALVAAGVDEVDEFPSSGTIPTGVAVGKGASESLVKYGDDGVALVTDDSFIFASSDGAVLRGEGSAIKTVLEIINSGRTSDTQVAWVDSGGVVRLNSLLVVQEEFSLGGILADGDVYNTFRRSGDAAHTTTAWDRDEDGNGKMTVTRGVSTQVADTGFTTASVNGLENELTDAVMSPAEAEKYFKGVYGSDVSFNRVLINGIDVVLINGDAFYVKGGKLESCFATFGSTPCDKIKSDIDRLEDDISTNRERADLLTLDALDFGNFLGDWIYYTSAYQGMAGWSSIFWGDDSDYLKNWKEDANKLMCDILGISGTECWTSRICEAWPDGEVSSGAPHVGQSAAFTRDADGALRPAAHIQGSKSQAITFEGATRSSLRDLFGDRSVMIDETWYNLSDPTVDLSGIPRTNAFMYKVTYWVQPGEETDLNVVFKGDTNVIPWYTPALRVLPGQPKARDNAFPIHIITTHDFSELCLTFSPGLETSGGDSRDELCTTFSQYAGAATPPTIAPAAEDTTPPSSASAQDNFGGTPQNPAQGRLF